MTIIAWLIGPIGRYLLIAIVVAGSWLWIKQHYEAIGYAKAIHAVAAQDQKAVAASKVATTTVSECFAKGKWWNVENMSCDDTKP